MLKVEHLEVWGFEHAIRGMRNPLNSWDKSDSHFGGKIKMPGGKKYNLVTGEVTEVKDEIVDVPNFRYLGDADLELMRKLYKAGPEHRKYLRQIFVSLDITAPLYWWKEFDTYKVGTVANSCSTMHKIAAKEFEMEDFSNEHLNYTSFRALEELIRHLNSMRDWYNETKNKDAWWQLIQLLPSSYNQKRTVTMNYENVITIIKQRTGHKLDEWKTLIDSLEELPYIKEITNGC